MQTVLTFIKNNRFYSISTGVLLLLLFLDNNGVISQLKHYRELNELEDEKVFYQQKKKDVERQWKEVMGNQQLIEKYAREKYFMKKPKEELFVIVNEKDEFIEK